MSAAEQLLLDLASLCPDRELHHENAQGAEVRIQLTTSCHTIRANLREWRRRGVEEIAHESLT